MTSSHPKQRAARANSQPGHVGFPFRCWDPGEKTGRTRVTSSGQDKKKGSETVGQSDRAADVGWMVEIHWGKMGREASYITDYLDLVGAYLVSHMITCSAAAK